MNAAITPDDPPVAARKPSERTLHGVRLVDEYAWLKDENWQAVLKEPAKLAPDIRIHLEAENRYTAAVLAPTEALQRALIAEMRGRIKEDDAGVPAPDGPWAYFWKYAQGGEHEMIGRQPRLGGEAQFVIDGDALAKSSDYFDFGETRHSPDHELMAWSADLRGSEYFSLRVRRWSTGADLPDLIEQTSGNAVWGHDSTFFYYVRLDDNHRPLQVFRHRLGTPQTDDALVYQEPDEGWFTRIEESSSGRFCVIATGNQETSERWLLDLSDANATPRLVATRETGVRYSIYDRGEQLFIHTNEGGAIDFKIAVAPLVTPDRAHWHELIPHRPGVYILDVALFAGHLVRLERSNALPSIVIRDLADGSEHSIAFAEAAYSLDIFEGYEFETTTLRFSYSSMTTPLEVYDYDMATRARILRKRQTIPSGHDPAHYVTTRIIAKSHDGAEVPVSILHRKDFVRDGSAPLLLYGYGS
ncbi:MAG TPA: S9 family peptidase, partial [Reyranellaceae bacterium]|nr:S9 family peptidase [Reyranellaceae bacterium]